MEGKLNAAALTAESRTKVLLFISRKAKESVKQNETRSDQM
jgi:hypothetical protein